MRFSIFSLSLALLSPGFAKFPDNFDQPLEVIAFGSCNRDELPQPVWAAVTESNPDLWIWGGDNIYVDWHENLKGEELAKIIDRGWVTERYAAQFNHPDYTEFRETTPILGTWDDHDYGKNNAYGDFAMKEITRDLALAFMEVPLSDPRWTREGLYGSYDFGPEGQRTRVILLDNRYFATHPDEENATILGATQKEWLDAQFRKSGADLHVIVSGTQVLSADHQWDSWQKYSSDKQWLIDLIRENKTPTLFITGDRHIHEISKVEVEGVSFPLVDLTSSGMTHSWETFPGEPNSARVGEVYTGLGYGLIQIDWASEEITVTFEIRDTDNEVENSIEISYSR